MREPASEKDIWWAAPDGQASNGAPNYEMDERWAHTFRSTTTCFLFNLSGLVQSPEASYGLSSPCVSAESETSP